MQSFVHLLRLIAQNVANVFNLTSGIRVSVVTCCAENLSRGSHGSQDMIAFFPWATVRTLAKSWALLVVFYSFQNR